MVALLHKIERWWIVNVDAVYEVDERAVVGGRSIELKLLTEIALGSEEESRKYLDEYIRLIRPTTSPGKVQ
jgi:hypothetical protein